MDLNEYHHRLNQGFSEREANRMAEEKWEDDQILKARHESELRSAHESELYQQYFEEMRNAHYREMFEPFVAWEDDYFGLITDKSGRIVDNPPGDHPDLTEWHIVYYGGDIWEIEYAPTEEGANVVYRGKIQSREFFVALMRHFENPPKIDWSNAEASR